jgi:hypothetical protein
VFTGSGDTTAKCFDPKSSALRRTFAGHLFCVTGLEVNKMDFLSISHKACWKTKTDFLLIAHKACWEKGV